MHPLRMILYVSLAVAAAVSVAFGYLLQRLAIAPAEIVIIAAAVFIAFLVPWLAVSLWALRYASDVDELTRRTRAVLESDDARIADRAYHEDLDELAHAIDELHAIIARQRESAEERRRATQQIIDSLGEGLLAINAKRQVVTANERVGRMFGFSGRMEGQLFIEVVRRHSLAEAFERALNGEASSVRITVGEGVERQIEIRVSPVQSSEIAAIALFIDVTDIERLQRARKEFLDDFSHEVRTPLAGLRSAMETFDRELKLHEEEQLRGVMKRQLARIERLVKDLAELNTIESGGIVLDRHPTDLLALAEDLVDDFRLRHAGQPIGFVVRGSAVTANVDASRLQQILGNLLDNACKHGRRGEVLVEVMSENAEAVVRVSDEGEGIPAADVERIFHRFYRVDRSRSQHVPGVGLGLAIAKHLTAALGGSIRAFNRPGRGATFEVRLPISESATSRRAG